MIRFKLYAVILIFNLVLLFGQKDVVNDREKRDPASQIIEVFHVLHLILRRSNNSI